MERPHGVHDREVIIFVHATNKWLAEYRGGATDGRTQRPERQPALGGARVGCQRNGVVRSYGKPRPRPGQPCPSGRHRRYLGVGRAREQEEISETLLRDAREMLQETRDNTFDEVDSPPDNKELSDIDDGDEST